MVDRNFLNTVVLVFTVCVIILLHLSQWSRPRVHTTSGCTLLSLTYICALCVHISYSYLTIKAPSPFSFNAVTWLPDFSVHSVKIFFMFLRAHERTAVATFIK